MAEQKAPTPEEMAKLQKVSNAGAQAASEADNAEQATDDAKKAMREERDRVGLQMSDEELDKVADLFVGKTIKEFENRGAFDAPPERVQPPAQPTAPPPPGEAAQPGAEAEQAPQAPVKRTFAHRFMGG
jgi:hypothetical protein